MQMSGTLSKMHITVANPAQYKLIIGEQQVNLNDYIGKHLELEYKNEIYCTACGKLTKKSYQQGYCYPCTIKLAQCDLCILKPELCHLHLGTCREPDWAEAHCQTSHIVYLANTTGIKVGITRETQIPTRWLDQGAVQAIPFIRVKTRYQSGLIEVIIKKFINDKTNWRDLLKADPKITDLAAIRDEILAKSSDAIKDISGKFKFGDIELLTNEKQSKFTYPIDKFPQIVKSIKLDKVEKISSVLTGVKGQYLFFAEGAINIRNHSGYMINFIVN